MAEQQSAGIDIVSDGEQTRQHFVTTFIENLGGVDFENRRVMTIRDRYEAAVPVVVEAVTRKQRSEEHTSELQSRGHLVCRLLLEQKKTISCEHRKTQS